MTRLVMGILLSHVAFLLAWFGSPSSDVDRYAWMALCLLAFHLLFTGLARFRREVV